MLVKIFVFLSLLLSQKAFSAECSGVSSERVNKLVEDLAKTQQVAPSWTDHHIKNVPVGVVDHSVSSECLFIISEFQKTAVISLPEPWPFQGSGYTFIPNSKRFPNYPGLKGRKIGIQKNGYNACCGRAHKVAKKISGELEELNIDFLYVQALEKASGGYRDSPSGRYATFFLVMHEIFHFFRQNRGVSNAPWAWKKVGTGRRVDMVKKCYEPQQNLLEKEVKALNLAYQMKDEPEAAMSFLREFTQYRAQRYAMLPRIDEGRVYGEFRTCEMYEANLEYLEGTAQFLGHSMSLKVGLVDHETLVQFFSANTSFRIGVNSVLYYNIGSMVFLTLEKLMGEKFLPLIKEINDREVYLPLHKVIERALF